MNRVVGVLLLLSVAVTASALAVGNQEYEEENVQDQTGEQAVVEQRLLDALQNAPKARKGLCVTECVRWKEDKHCIRWFFWACTEEKTERKCEYSVQRCSNPKHQSRSYDPEVEAVERDNSEADDAPEAISEGEKSALAKLEKESETAFRNFYAKKVVKAERYELTSSEPDQDTPEEKAVIVIVTLTSGRRFAIARGKKLWKSETTAIVKAERVTEGWQLVESKNVQFSTVADYVKVSDSSSSSTEAAEKMMLLE